MKILLAYEIGGERKRALFEAKSADRAKAYFSHVLPGGKIIAEKEVDEKEGAGENPLVVSVPDDDVLMELEGVARMKILKMHENAIEDFQHGVLNCSEYGGILFWLSEDKIELVSQFEQRTGGRVYHLIENNSSLLGNMVTMLYVSRYFSEWERERNSLAEDGYTIAYVENVTYPDCSEFGGVMVAPLAGGLSRVA